MSLLKCLLNNLKILKVIKKLLELINWEVNLKYENLSNNRFFINKNARLNTKIINTWWTGSDVFTGIIHLYLHFCRLSDSLGNRQLSNVTKNWSVKSIRRNDHWKLTDLTSTWNGLQSINRIIALHEIQLYSHFCSHINLLPDNFGKNVNKI